MTTRRQISGHPIHPALVHFPAALWPSSLLWDIAGLWCGDRIWWEMSFWCLALGLIAALPAIATGLMDYVSLSKGDPALGVANAHMLLMSSAGLVFLVSVLVRGGPAATPPPAATLAMAFSALGVALLVVGGWLGATLVYRHGVGQVEAPRA